MKKNKLKILILTFLILLTTTGCTVILKDKDKKVIKNPLTDQSLVENVLCRPTDKEVIKIYKDNKVKIDSLPECQDMKIVDGYDGFWTTLFVRPLTWLLIKIGTTLNNYAFSIIIITLILRVLMIPITNKTARQSENMKKAQPEIAKLETKYKNKESQEEMMAKTQELMAIYKKHDISMFSTILTTFLQIPIFFAFYEALNRLPAIYEQTIFNSIHLGTTPFKGIQTGNMWYLIILLLAVAATYFSFKTNPTPDDEASKQMKPMMNVMIIIVMITSIFLPVGIGIYWIVNNGFAAVQNLIIRNKTPKNPKKPEIIKTPKAFTSSKK